MAGYDEIGDDMAGAFYLTNDNAAVNCTPPSPAHLAVHVCRRSSSSASVKRGFAVSASGDSPDGVKRMELWMNGQKAFETWSDQMYKWLSPPPGTYNVTVIAVDVDGTHVAAPVFTMTVR